MQNSRRIPSRAGISQRAGHVALLTALVALAPVASFAADAPAAKATAKPSSKAACEAAHGQLDEAERQGHLQAAKELASSCSAPSCKAWVADQCRARFQTLSENIPTVVPVALDGKGAPIADAELRIDGSLSTSPINGPALSFDPGLHELAFSAPGREPRVEKLAILQGVKNRQISVVLVTSAGATPAVGEVAAPLAPASPQTAPAIVQPHDETAVVRAPAPAATQTSIWPYVAGGAGLAALGTSVALATWGHHDFELLDRCAPNCRQSSLDHVRRMYITADISLGVGALALGIATWLYFSEPTKTVPTDQTALRLDVQPVRGGAFATLEQAF